MREGWGSLTAGMGGGVGGTACALFFGHVFCLGEEMIG